MPYRLWIVLGVLALPLAVCTADSPRDDAIATTPIGSFVELHLHDGRRVYGRLTTDVAADRIGIMDGQELTSLRVESTFPRALVASVQPAALPPLPVEPDIPAAPFPLAGRPPVGPLRMTAWTEPPIGPGQEPLLWVSIDLPPGAPPIPCGSTVELFWERPAVPNFTDRRRAVRNPPPARLVRFTRTIRPADLTETGLLLNFAIVRSAADEQGVPEILEQVRVTLQVPGQPPLETRATLIPAPSPALGLIRNRIIGP